MCDFSRNVLEDRNQRLYPMIYQVGPLNALIMDIMLREQTNGEKGLLELVYTLMDRYGPRKPFEDDELFGVIGELAGPETEQYCRTYLEDGRPFPFAQYLPKIGLTYQDSTTVDRLSYGIDISDESKDIGKLVLEPADDNPLGIKAGDIALKVDGKEIGEHTSYVYPRLFSPRSKDSEVTITVLRNGEEIELTGTPTTVQRTVKHVIGEVEELTDDQLRLRNLVFYGNAVGSTENTSRSTEP